MAEEYEYNPDDGFYRLASFQSAENGRLTGGEVYNLDGSVAGYFSDFTYDGDYITGYTICDLDGTVLRTIEFAYDAEGIRTVRTMKYFPGGGFSTTRIFDENGNCIQEIQQGDSTTYTNWEYNENGDSTGYTVTDEYGNVIAWTHNIYDNGRYIGFEYYDSTNESQPYGQVYEDE